MGAEELRTEPAEPAPPTFQVRGVSEVCARRLTVKGADASPPATTLRVAPDCEPLRRAPAGRAGRAAAPPRLFATPRKDTPPMPRRNPVKPAEWTCKTHRTPIEQDRCPLCDDQLELFAEEEVYPPAIRAWRAQWRSQ